MRSRTAWCRWGSFLAPSIDGIATPGRSPITFPIGEENALGKGGDVNSVYKDAAGYLWLASGGNGVDSVR